MASLDDTIISRQNLMLLDNVTNYKKPALDYFHHEFSSERLEMPMTWTLLLKMRKHKLLRLPSCASEDDADYNSYLMRLHHCLWRRWSMEHYKLQNLKVDPLSINWNKETDITVLYGPDLTGACANQELEDIALMNIKGDSAQLHEQEEEEEVIVNPEVRSYTYSSSVDSNVSSIFDENNTCMKTHSNTSNRSLKFDDTVLRREIDSHGSCHESRIVINDLSKVPRHLRRLRKKRRHQKKTDSDTFIGYQLPLDDDELELEGEFCNFGI